MEKVIVFFYKSVILLCVVVFFYVEIFLFDIFFEDDLMVDGKKMLVN